MDDAGRLRVLRISHSSVVTTWRQRETALADLGVDADLLCARQWNEGGVTVRCRRQPGERLETVGTLGTHPCGFLYDPRVLWHHLRRGTYDIIDVHEEPYSLAAAQVVMLASLAAPGTPIVFYSAQNLFKRYSVPVRLLERFVERRSAGAYPCSTGAADVLRRKRFGGVLTVVPLGVETPGGDRSPDDLTLGEAPLDGRDSFTIGFAGRLEVRKGLLVLLNAVAGEPGWTLLIAGDGPDRKRLERHVEEVAPSATVRFLGHLDDDGLGRFYRRIDVLAAPSLATPGWVEQFCRSAVEAMATGVPVVASDTGALPEVIGSGGLLVRAGDVLALHAGLDGLARDPAHRRLLGREALGVSERFTWRRVAALQHDLYRAVLAA